jgi:hypothetical protein
MVHGKDFVVSAFGAVVFLGTISWVLAIIVRALV